MERKKGQAKIRRKFGFSPAANYNFVGMPISFKERMNTASISPYNK
jgi:hypothetical protein